MRLIALYKTFDGEEWLDGSLASIYEHVDSIVMVHSSISWTGKHGNTCEAVAKRWSDEHDTDGKVHHVACETTNQMEQYRVGLTYIEQQRLNWDAVLAIDSDEIWEGDQLEALKAKADKSPASKCKMATYVKTPYYRVQPHFGTPVVLFRDPNWLTKSPRGNRAPSPVVDCWMHHLTYVRDSYERVAAKMASSAEADLSNERLVPTWKEDVWDRLPHASNLHGFQKWRHVWRGVERVWRSDLPACIRESRGMDRFWPGCLLMDGEQNILRDLAIGKGVAVDLGTYCGSSAIIMSLGAQQVHTVDAFEDVDTNSVSDEIGPTYEDMQRDTGHTFASVSEYLSMFSNVTVHKSDTVAAAALFDDGSVDLLFIDADHSYEGTRRNWEAWHAKIAIGGMCLFHDVNELHPGVQRAVASVNPRLMSSASMPKDSRGSLALFRKAG